MVMRPDNDFSWSSWLDAEAAASEIDGYLAQLSRDEPISAEIMFAPTGPMQELSISSGWGSEFVALADRYDAVMLACACVDDPSDFLIPVQELGMDHRFGQVSQLRCKSCGRPWVRYLLEDEATSKSGRWFLGQVSVSAAEDARGALESLPRYLMGGSYFGVKERWSSGTLPG